MSEGFSSYGMTATPPPSLETAAANFRSKVEEASNRLTGAAEQFVAMSDGLLAAVEQARQAAERAEAARQSVEEMQARVAQSYGTVNDLVRDLQQRIAALATLAQPLSLVPEPQPEPVHEDEGNPGESRW